MPPWLLARAFREVGVCVNQRDAGPPIIISLVVPVYGVEAYIGEFLSAIDAQTFDRSRLELIFVIDGSPDDSERLIRLWLECYPGQAKVLTQANQGLSSARNLGMGNATGVWISFPDPDDSLGADYLQQVAEFMDSPGCEPINMIAARLLPFVHDPSSLTAPHHLDFRFDRQLRIVDLTNFPHFVHMHSASGFYRLDAVRRAGCRFDGQIRPVYEDGAFTAQFMLRTGRPIMALVGSARYLYRRRQSQDSLTQTAWRHPGKYNDVLRHGYLELFREAGTPIPRWLQYQIFCDLQWYPKEDARMDAGTAGMTETSLQEFQSCSSGPSAILTTRQFSTTRPPPFLSAFGYRFWH